MGKREVAEYALYIQCPWRITDISKIVVGSYDKYIPNSKIEYSNEFGWDVQGKNRCDRNCHLVEIELLISEFTM